MGRARVYLAAGPTQVTALQRGALPAGATVVALAPGATEEREHEGWLEAAELAGQDAAREGRRRVVVSADVDTAALDPAPTGSPTTCVLVAPLPVRAVVSLHVDEEVGGGIADLLWYDVTELEDVATLLTPGPDQPSA